MKPFQKKKKLYNNVKIEDTHVRGTTVANVRHKVPYNLAYIKLVPEVPLTLWLRALARCLPKKNFKVVSTIFNIIVLGVKLLLQLYTYSQDYRYAIHLQYLFFAVSSA